MTGVLRLEVCVDTAEGIEIAAKHGADRIELCASLGVGGLTPSLGMMRLASTYACPSRAMVRPRQGDFVYGDTELSIMLHDIDAVAAYNLEGVVFGANKVTGELDSTTLERLTRHAKSAGLKVTLHRSFDIVPNVLDALAIAHALGIDTILTSGGAPNALQGADVIRTLVDAAASSGQHPAIEVMAGVGISAETASDIVKHTGVTWVHGSCSLPRGIESPAWLGYNSPDDRRTDAEVIADLRSVLQDLTREVVVSD